MSLLSRGTLRDIEFTYSPIADECDTYTCRQCERVFTDDTKVENHPKYNACICHPCLDQWHQDNE